MTAPSYTVQNQNDFQRNLVYRTLFLGHTFTLRGMT